MYNTRIAVLASLLVALIVAAGQALAGVPNIELITFLVFVSGFLLGAPVGAVVGGAAMGVHSMFNAMGGAVLPVLVVQVLCYAAIGAIGGVAGVFVARQKNFAAAALISAMLGFVITLGYQLPINVVTFYVFTSDATLWPYIWGGVVFSAVHIVWNTVLFFVTLRPTLAALSGRRAQLRMGR